MSILYNRPRIIPFNPEEEPIVLGGVEDNVLPMPIRPTVNPTTAPLDLELPTRSMTNVLNDQEDDSWIQERFNKLYKPETTNIDRLNAMIETMPQRNKPGLLRQIFGGIAQGVGGGPEARQEVLYRPYFNQMADWNAKMKPVESAANIERQNNVNMRNVANQILSQEMNNRRLTRQLERDAVLAEQGNARINQGDVRLNQADRRLAQGDRRLDIAEEVALGGQFEVDDAGNARIIRKDGTTIPVDASYLSFTEKERLRAQSAENVARARAAGSRDRVRTEVISDPDDPTGQRKIAVIINQDTGQVTRATITKEDGTTTTISPTVRGSETEEGKDVVNKANAAKNSNPTWSKYITIKGNTVNIQRPGMSVFGRQISGPTQEEYKAMYQAIFGTAPPVVETKPTDTSNKPNPPANKKPETTTQTGTMPPVNKRTKGMKWTFPNGKVAEWDGTQWVTVTK